MITTARLLVAAAALSISSQFAGAVPVYLLTKNNSLVVMDSASPGAAAAPVAITGLGSFDLVGIDIRTTVQTISPANPGVGTLWALGVDGANTRLFVINPDGAAATPVGPVLTGINGSGSGDNGWFFGHNPGNDRFRLMNFINNYELDPNTLTFVTQTDLINFPNPNGSAFETASFGQSPRLFLMEQAPNDSLHSATNIATGNFAVVGDTGLSFSIGSGLDVAGNTMLFAATVGVANLYTINRTTGAATLIGAISGNPTVRALTIAPTSFPPKLPVTIRAKGPKVINTSAALVTIKGTAKSASGIRRVDFRVGKAAAKKAKGKTRWTARIPVSPGANQVTIRATGGNDVVSKPARVTIIRN
jgi:hypothetical protein